MSNEAADTQSAPHYRQPGWVTRNVFNRLVARLTRMGISVWGSRVLEVRGRSTGQPRRTPVNLLTVDGQSYLVSARGEGQWVRNVRAGDGRLALIVGRRRAEYIATEMSGDAKRAILRSYLRRWKMEVGVFFDGVDADSSDEELDRVAPKHPVFVLSAS